MKKIGDFLFNFFSCDLKWFYGQKLAVINIFFIPLIYLYLKYNFPFYYTVLIYFFCLLFFSKLSIIKISSFCMILILLYSTAFYSIYNTRNFINSLDSKKIWSDKIKIIDVISPKSKVGINFSFKEHISIISSGFPT